MAALAGVSVGYYERLEQARGSRPSAQVLGTLGSALRLSTVEREHLARLAGQVPPGVVVERGVVSDEARGLLDRLAPTAAYLVDERQYIVAWNAPAAVLIPGLAELGAAERNVVRLAMRWGGTLCRGARGAEGVFVRQVAAQLRVAGARFPGDRVLGELVNEFAAHSAGFAAGWRDHDVRPVPSVRKVLRHPVVGEVEVVCQTLVVPGSDLGVVMFLADPGSAGAAALGRLGVGLCGGVGECFAQSFDAVGQAVGVGEGVDGVGVGGFGAQSGVDGG